MKSIEVKLRKEAVMGRLIFNIELRKKSEYNQKLQNDRLSTKNLIDLNVLITATVRVFAGQKNYFAGQNWPAGLQLDHAGLSETNMRGQKSKFVVT